MDNSINNDVVGLSVASRRRKAAEQRLLDGMQGSYVRRHRLVSLRHYLVAAVIVALLVAAIVTNLKAPNGRDMATTADRVTMLSLATQIFNELC